MPQAAPVAATVAPQRLLRRPNLALMRTITEVQVAQLRTVVLGDGVESIHRAVVQGIALVGDDAVHQQMHSIRISDLQPALIDVESGVCGDMGGDAVHLIGGGLIDHRGGGGVEISHVPDGQRTGSHRRAVLLRVCAYRKLGLDPLLLLNLSSQIFHLCILIFLYHH